MNQILAEEEAQPKVANVTFNPSLWLQRRTWVLNQLREHRATSVVDLGCGEGSLLSVLCQPASTIPPKTAVECNEPTLDIHISRLIGLDIDDESLKIAVEETAPPPTDRLDDLPPWERPRPRWLDLDVQIWKGGLEVLNEGESGNEGRWFGSNTGEWDAIVSTEVVEHLPNSILPHFIPTTLGVYKPKLLLLTTPNYTFNQLFTAPGVANNLTGYPDPTGETDRVFRHHDHKREWTTEEWTEWCEQAAREWGYDVQVGGIGVSEEEDPWGRTKLVGKASLTAMFKRKELPSDPEERATLERKREDALLAARRRTTPISSHQLLATHHHPAHSSIGSKPTQSALINALKQVLEPAGELGLRNGAADVDELWLQDSIAILCGGDLDVLLNAIEAASSDEWELSKDDSNDLARQHFIPSWREKKWAWRVRWKGFVKPPTPEPPESEKEDEEAEYRWRSTWDGWKGWDNDDGWGDDEVREDGEAEVHSSPPTSPNPEEIKEGEAVSDGWGVAPADDWGLTESWNTSGWVTEEATWT
ncbi:hypothetical protein FRC04_011709 [Tulasnella sp. 424]|nr:hypothetical protein FRC04_011709 [Tulasnella sp. 424]KAG8978055.1 hypothetical protein FRC05_011170 [Tulasnella sp. 425]